MRQLILVKLATMCPRQPTIILKQHRGNEFIIFWKVPSDLTPSAERIKCSVAIPGSQIINFLKEPKQPSSWNQSVSQLAKEYTITPACTTRDIRLQCDFPVAMPGIKQQSVFFLATGCNCVHGSLSLKWCSTHEKGEITTQ